MSRIYLISPENFEEAARQAHNLKGVLEAADIPCFQLRLKNASDDEWRKAIEALQPICVNNNTAFIINDRADLAKQFDCDGVHIGRDDGLYSDARKIVGDKKIVGVSAYASTDDAMDLAAAGADYVAFGSVFPSSSKELAPPVGLEVLEAWVEMANTPCVAIGGITAANCAPLVQANVDFLAVIGAVWNHGEGPAAGAQLLQKAIEAAKSE
jgi:thiamine-phosphate pyrophosphorylase